MKNKKQIAMRCNQEQYEAIKPKLEKANIEIFSITKFKKDTFLCLLNDMSITNGILLYNKDNYEVHEEWNEKIFLEACGIETIPTLEEVKERFKYAETIKSLFSGKEDTITGDYELFGRDWHIKGSETEREVWSNERGYAKILTYKTPKFDITKEQILELYNTGNPKPTIRKMFPEVFEKFNGWASDSLRINKNWLGYYENSILKYGIDSEGQWFVSESKSKFEECETNIKATPEEVTEALKKEAVRRYKIGDLIKNIEGYYNGETNNMLFGGEYFCIDSDGSFCVKSTNNFWIRIMSKEGIWAEIIQTKTIQQAEELLKELGHEIKIVS